MICTKTDLIKRKKAKTDNFGSWKYIIKWSTVMNMVLQTNWTKVIFHSLVPKRYKISEMSGVVHGICRSFIQHLGRTCMRAEINKDNIPQSFVEPIFIKYRENNAENLLKIYIN